MTVWPEEETTSAESKSWGMTWGAPETDLGDERMSISKLSSTGECVSYMQAILWGKEGRQC